MSPRCEPDEIDGCEGGGAQEHREIQPCLPIVDGPGRDEQQHAYDNRERDERERCSRGESHRRFMNALPVAFPSPGA